AVLRLGVPRCRGRARGTHRDASLPRRPQPDPRTGRGPCARPPARAARGGRQAVSGNAKAPDGVRQARIMAELGVAPDFDAAAEIGRRVAFLVRYLEQSRLSGYVLGISGGVDSLAAGHLAPRAVERVRAKGGKALFHAMRLPYGAQRDETEAQRCIASIGPDRVLTVDIAPACDALFDRLRESLTFRDLAHEDFVLGNIKARQRMIAQYAVAGAHGALVIGTDHAAEAAMGFFTKHGDGAADVVPLAGLNKRRVRALARAMGAPEELVAKVPTADLETL